MKRGSFVSVAAPGDFSKPRPALVIQSDRFDEHATVTVLLVASTRIDAPLIRLDVLPTPGNGLRVASQVMIDKAMALRRERIGAAFGEADDQLMLGDRGYIVEPGRFCQEFGRNKHPIKVSR